MGYSIGFQVSKLASEIKDLRMSSLKEASKLVREVKQYHQEEELIFRPGMAWQPEDIAVVAVHDASFNNLPGHKSQKGYWLGISTPELIKDRTKVHHMPFCSLDIIQDTKVGAVDLESVSYTHLTLPTKLEV